MELGPQLRAVKWVDELPTLRVQRLWSAGKVSKSSPELVPFSVADLTYSSLVVKAQQATDLDLLLYFCLGWDVQTPASQNKFRQSS